MTAENQPRSSQGKSDNKPKGSLKDLAAESQAGERERQEPRQRQQPNLAVSRAPRRYQGFAHAEGEQCESNEAGLDQQQECEVMGGDGLLFFGLIRQRAASQFVLVPVRAGAVNRTAQE